MGIIIYTSRIIFIILRILHILARVWFSFAYKATRRREKEEDDGDEEDVEAKERRQADLT